MVSQASHLEVLGRQAVGVKSNEEEGEEEENKEEEEKENRSLNLNTKLPGLLVKGNSHRLLSVKHVGLCLCCQWLLR